MTQQEPEPVIRLRKVYRTFTGNPPVQALQPCDLSVWDGDYVAITGPSGSGKSALLTAVGLLDEFSGGTYLLRGTDVSLLGEGERAAVRSRHLGFVFQALHLLPDRTAGENVELAMLHTAAPRVERSVLARTILTRVGLGHRVSAFPPALSGGECQRVAIARAVAVRPSVLLCDEPAGSLDATAASAVLDLIDVLNSEGLTVVAVTGDERVGDRARRLMHLRDGLTEARALPGGHDASGTDTR